MKKEFKVGDRVWDILLQEWGEITRFDEVDYPLVVYFENVIRYYSIDGKLGHRDKMPVIYHDKPSCSRSELIQLAGQIARGVLSNPEELDITRQVGGISFEEYVVSLAKQILKEIYKQS